MFSNKFTKELVFVITIIAIAYCYALSASLDESNELWWSGEYEKAIDVYQELAQDNNYSFSARMNLAALYRSLSDYNSAIDEYKNIISNGVNFDISEIGKVYIFLAESLYYNKQLKESKKYFEKALNLFPEHENVMFGLGRVFFDLSKLKKAEVILNRIIKVDPEFTGSYIYLAKIAEKRNKTEEAIEYYRKALKKDSQHVELRFWLADNYLKQGLNENAYRQYYKLKNVDSKNKYVSDSIKKILPLLTRKPEEIIERKSLEEFSLVRVIGNPEKIPVVRIGLNTSGRGRINPMKSVVFMTDGGFCIMHSEKKYFSGETRKIYSITVSGNVPEVTIKEEGSKNVYKLPQKFSVILNDLVKGAIILKDIEYAKGYAWGGIEDRQYRRRLDISAVKGGFKVINILNLEEYLYGVVPSEMMVSYPEEALNAQAVIARTLALYRKKVVKPHVKNGYDLCDSQHCQVYKGVSNEWKKTNDAVDDTRGEILYYKNKVAHPLFHSNCGGHTVSSGELKGWGSVSYLTGTFDGSMKIKFPDNPLAFEKWIKSNPDVYCNIPELGWNAEFRWLRIVPAVFLEEKINRVKKIGKIKNIIINRRSRSGHVLSVSVLGTEGELIIEKEHKIRRNLAIGPLRSNMFWLETKYNTDGYPEEFVFYGGGWGHGVGLCQDGAAGTAKQGYSYKEILEHYYKNTLINKESY